MKIRTDFVTNSSSSSFVAVNINSPTLDAFLEKLGLSSWFKEQMVKPYVEEEELEEEEETLDGWFNWVLQMMAEDEEIVTMELQTSTALNLLALIDRVGTPYWGGDEEEQTIEKLRTFLREKQALIDAEAEGSITVKAADGEDGFAYYQKLETSGGHGRLTQWPAANGWSEEGYSAIQEYNCEHGPIFETIWSDEELATYLEKDGKVTEF